jgi:integrase
LHHSQIPAFIAALRERPGVAARALELLLLTAARSGELRGMTFDEIKLGYTEDVAEPTPVWVIPAFRMKMFRRHRVPLASAAIAIVEAQRLERQDDNPLVFPGARPGKPLTNSTMRRELARLGFGGPTTTHGLRASFRSWCKATGVPFETAEEALAHIVGDSTSQSYDRDDQLALRVGVMERWAQYCLSASKRPPAAENRAEAPRRRTRKENASELAAAI